jgi:hypothetical protein
MFSYQIINRNREMNKHIELVKKWIADKDSVSQQELKENRASAYDAYAAYAATASSAAAAAAADADNATYWIKRYEELSK